MAGILPVTIDEILKIWQIVGDKKTAVLDEIFTVPINVAINKNHEIFSELYAVISRRRNVSQHLEKLGLIHSTLRSS